MRARCRTRTTSAPNDMSVAVDCTNTVLVSTKANIHCLDRRHALSTSKCRSEVCVGVCKLLVRRHQLCIHDIRLIKLLANLRFSTGHAAQQRSQPLFDSNWL